MSASHSSASRSESAARPDLWHYTGRVGLAGIAHKRLLRATAADHQQEDELRDAVRLLQQSYDAITGDGTLYGVEDICRAMTLGDCTKVAVKKLDEPVPFTTCFTAKADLPEHWRKFGN
ncbi:hypothetical protein [Allobranchiibius sp. GilTou38]|uniref:hypothetical protein n=1 Tax=Allobranchiibius sp. GilTou38 TaxID=2815210 RepID=UPI001AA11321|nr:hypothetical protein [Allobranchiibius sp. GilTou38]MBO1768240.1 hypothetical protein [Allobranchiibius sp. GilTou38]